jgi:hypothetical protein
MKKVNWEKVWDFVMKSVAIAVGSIIVYTATKIAIAVITSIYVVLIK